MAADRGSSGETKAEAAGEWRKPGERAALSSAEVVICWILITTTQSLKLYNAHRTTYVIGTIELSALQKELMHFELSIT